MALFWLSFVDPDRPKGERFMGVTLVEVDAPEDVVADGPEHKEIIKAVIRRAWAHGANPGGQVESIWLRTDVLAQMSNDQRVKLAKAPRDTLLSKEELHHYDLI